MPHKTLVQRARTFVLGVISALAGFGITTSPGCGTDAKGVEECRDIEFARCAAAAPCGIVPDVAACQRFYRDHCLHGMAVDPPAPDIVEACVKTIEAAGACASASPDGVDATIASCDNDELLEASGASLACDIVRHPEYADNCDFLTPAPPPVGNEGGAGGEPGR